MILVFVWYHRKTGKFTVNKKENPAEFVVRNDLYGFVGQPNHNTDADDQNCYEEYDVSKGQKLKPTNNSSCTQSNSQNDKQNTMLTDNPLYGDYEVYDGTVDTDENHDPPEAKEIYMNIGHNNCGTQVGICEEYNYCKH